MTVHEYIYNNALYMYYVRTKLYYAFGFNIFLSEGANKLQCMVDKTRGIWGHAAQEITHIYDP